MPRVGTIVMEDLLMPVQEERNPKTDLHLLLRAKQMSDQRNYHEKNKILRNLLVDKPEDFVIDSDLNRKFVGITHVPTSFKVHAPRDIIPSSISRQERMDKIAEDLAWSYVPDLVNTYVLSSKEVYEKVARALLPRTHAWISPTSDKVLTESGDVSTTLEKAGVSNKVGKPNLNSPWILVKSASDTLVSSVLGPVAQAFMLKPSKFSDHIGGPTPLASMIAGGALTAGLGYGAGTIAENIAPGVFEKGKLRKRMAMLGGLVGALPGAAMGGIGMHTWDAKSNPDRDSNSIKAFTSPNVLFGNSTITKASEALAQIQPEISEEMQKSSDFFGGGGISLAPVPVDAFNRLVLNDPFSPPYMQAATMGVVSAANSMGGGTGFITPMDIARVGIGMGAGYVQATLGGKVLGALVGLTPQAQRTLQGAGVVAGALKAVVPGFFGQ